MNDTAYAPTADLDLPGSVPIPQRLQYRRHNGRGIPVPYFVRYIDGKPDFRYVDPQKMALAANKRLCFLCGDPLGRHLAFLVGPMCTVNRISAEPPMHRECAEYAVRACPFLLDPVRTRRETKMPDGTEPPPGMFIERNPGVMAVWITPHYRPFKASGSTGVLFRMSEATEVIWYSRGRLATRLEVTRAIEEGLPSLMAEAVKDGEGSIRELNRCLSQATKLLPAAPAHGA